MAEKYGINIDLRGGIFVAKLYQGGPAWKGGVRPNDIITKFNGKKVGNVSDLRDMINSSGIGSSVTITVLRGDSEVDLTVVLGEMPKQ